MARKLILVQIAVLGLILTGCGDPKAANDKNFAAAINAYLDTNKIACTDSIYSWPVTVQLEANNTPTSRDSRLAERFDALAAVGLLSKDIAKRNLNPDSANSLVMTDEAPVNSARYDLTDQGKPYFRSLSARNSAFCFGKGRVNKVVKWAAPATTNGKEASQVTYSIQVSEVAAWANNAEVRKAFPEIEEILSGQKEFTSTLTLADSGWVVEGR